MAQTDVEFDGSNDGTEIRAHGLQTKNVQDIWHMPNYSLISWVPKTGKTKKSSKGKKS